MWRLYSTSSWGPLRPYNLSKRLRLITKTGNPLTGFNPDPLPSDNLNIGKVAYMQAVQTGLDQGAPFPSFPIPEGCDPGQQPVSGRQGGDDMREALTEAEIHRLGVHIIREELLQEGWIIPGVQRQPQGESPDRRPEERHPGARARPTARHPNRGAVENDDVVRSCVEHASRHNARCFFAGLRVSHAESARLHDERAMGVPFKGEGILVAFTGMEELRSREE